MKKKNKIIISAIITILVVIGIILSIVLYVKDDTKLTKDETRWINDNISKMQSVNMINNIEIYGNNGYGVFFDFITDFQNEYKIKVNPVTYNYLEQDVNSGFKLTNQINNNSVIFESDHYVLIGKEYKLIRNISDLLNINIGVLNNDSEYLKSYLDNLSLYTYNDIESLNNAFNDGNEITYMIVPRNLYFNYTIDNNYYFLYHFSDIKSYLIYQMDDNDILSNVIKKYFNNWKDKYLEKSINKHVLNAYKTNLKLSEAEMKKITSKVYNYGFLDNSPYEVLIGGNYGGIVSEYLSDFSDLTGVEFKFTKYRNYKLFNEAVDNGNIDIYFNYYNISNNYEIINTGMTINYYIIASEKNDIVVNSLKSLINKEVYVFENSILLNYLNNINGIDIKTYKSIDELKKIAKKNNIIMIDKETYEYMNNKELKGYSIRYQSTTDSAYTFKVNADTSFKKLFNTYVMSKSSDELKIQGLRNYNETVKKGNVLGSIAKYIIYIVIAIIVIIFILYKSSKKVKISKKIKKEDKIKFIDQLTSLKNRNYLNENIDSWNKNTIYPQTTIVIDLNRVQEINDKEGYEEGDKQIKAAANILIRTQLDNSDIMRTDGNEFLVYLVGYDERQITSYIKRLSKEFKEMPYDYGAEIGFSMIKDDLKTIEDAINESVEDMKNKKQEGV